MVVATRVRKNTNPEVSTVRRVSSRGNVIGTVLRDAPEINSKNYACDFGASRKKKAPVIGGRLRQRVRELFAHAGRHAAFSLVLAYPRTTSSRRRSPSASLRFAP